MFDKPKILELSSDFQNNSELFSDIYFNNLLLSDNQTITDRLNHLLKELKLGKTEFAESIEVDGGQWGKVLKGNMNATLKQILDITSKYGVRSGWLIDGEGPIYKKQKSGSVEKPDLQAQIKKQIDELRINFDTFVESLPAHASETHERKRVFEKLTADKPRKAGKR